MDLWIRSQDRDILKKIECVCVDIEELYYGKYCYSVESGGCVLGQYNTKERALEVLDEIQNLLQPRFVVNNSPTDDELCDMYAKENVFKVMPKDRVDINCIQANCIVYEMPNE